jgi:hypothetical protein
VEENEEELAEVGARSFGDGAHDEGGGAGAVNDDGVGWCNTLVGGGTCAGQRSVRA